MDQSKRKDGETPQNEGYLPPFDSIDDQSLAGLFGREAVPDRGCDIPPAAQEPKKSVPTTLLDERVEHQKQEPPGKPQLDITSRGELSIARGASTPLAGDPDLEPQGRAFRAREKQRANRRAKRAARREASAHNDQESATPLDNASGVLTKHVPAKNTTAKHKKSHHRPTPSERGMVFFLKIYQWSNLFFCSLNWPTYLQKRAAYYPWNMTGETQALKAKMLNNETICAISQAVKADWQPEHRATRKFLSTADLERFVRLKEEEVVYIEKQLAVIPEARDKAWEGFFCEVLDPCLLKEESASERVELPIEFTRDTLLPCLRAQVQALKARAEKARGLEQKYEMVRESYQRQRELRERLGSLQQDQARLLPICPVWKKVETQVTELRAEMMAQEAFSKLSHDNELARLAYEDALVIS